MAFVPSREEFVRLSARATVVPVYREVIADLDTPVSALAKLGPGPCTFLLESVERGDTLGRYSFLGNSALMTFQSRGEDVIITHADGRSEKERTSDALGRLERLLAGFRPAEVPGLPRFYGGAVGYVGFEGLSGGAPEGPAPGPEAAGPGPGDGYDALPDLYFIVTDAVLVFDHVRRNLKVVVNALPGAEPERAYDEACRRIEGILERLRGDAGLRPLAGVEVGRGRANGAALAGPGAAGLDGGADRFREAVRRAREHVRRGDVFQVVLSRRFAAPLRARPFDVYRLLRSVNPSPYMFYLDFGDVQLVGSSPEVMVRLEDGVAEVRPIAGTRPRGATPEDDRRLAAELLADEKERAEHAMLVDLGRDDLARVCRAGSVRVPRLMAVEKYSHVMHIVSDVVGELADGRTAFDLLRAAFPAGTVSGAPKARALELIRELEPGRRGPYAGAVGYFGFSGNMDSCITIRTIVVRRGVAFIQAGAGIVADSDPDRELQEIASKAGAMLQTVAAAEGVPV